MTSTVPRLIVISGPIASGKSTLAYAVSAEARRRGHTVALTDLDTVAEMALPTLPDWKWAHRIHAELVGAWLSTGIDLVVDEGSSSRHEVDLITDRVAKGVAVRHVVLTADFERSLERARGDPLRGVSTDPTFLRGAHDHFAAEMPSLPCDLLVHVEGRRPQDIAVEIVDRFGL